MADRVTLESIDKKLDDMRAEREQSLSEVRVTLTAHSDRLEGHDHRLAQQSLRLNEHDERLDKLEDRFDRALHAMRTGKSLPKTGKRPKSR